MRNLLLERILTAVGGTTQGLDQEAIARVRERMQGTPPSIVRATDVNINVSNRAPGQATIEQSNALGSTAPLEGIWEAAGAAVASNDYSTPGIPDYAGYGH